MGAFGEPGNLTKCSGLRMVVLLKEKYGKAKVPRGGIKVSGNLFHRIADEHERANLAPSVLYPRMREHAA